ncbi:hypothetical protein PR202_gb22070 [Eleusine coracana subsp. coracana]|uniref:Uncharacterized protein n=1 Tax=Eleusine coracana subsp. coracana TaxID=191504 RepID=A0AAV5FGR0_ELECO|nr:hypothetical protein QOZ80_7AG0582320 [Eleusine coracana subsp. coracana]GJN33466.1 hypothetical protein PR202_gb22070 [Eleusine coracana subsp. coracana]
MKMSARDHKREMSISEEDESPLSGNDLRRGPWTVEEDLLLVNYIAVHGEGRWNALARCAGLNRTGKSCRLRWLNYLRPDLRRGNITAQEQLLILELHSRWGNRWSKIAQHLPGRTDNEIKNYWRTRVQKHARQLNCDVNSQQFKDLMRYLWMPRLLERINNDNNNSSSPPSSDDAVITPPPQQQQQDDGLVVPVNNNQVLEMSCTTTETSSSSSLSTTDWMQQQQQALIVSTPAMVVSSSSCSDTWCQPPQMEYPPAHQFETTCWSSDEIVAAGVQDDMPDLWWGADVDLWYTQIMGLL